MCVSVCMFVCVGVCVCDCMCVCVGVYFHVGKRLAFPVLAYSVSFGVEGDYSSPDVHHRNWPVVTCPPPLPVFMWCLQTVSSPVTGIARHKAACRHIIE